MVADSSQSTDRTSKSQVSKSNKSPTIKVEVVFADPSKQKIVQLQIPVNSTARQAVNLSKLSSEFPEFDFASAAIGIFGRKVPDDFLLSDNDRIEIYRPLSQSPRDARRQRADSGKKPTHSR